MKPTTRHMLLLLPGSRVRGLPDMLFWASCEVTYALSQSPFTCSHTLGCLPEQHLYGNVCSSQAILGLS